MVYEGILEGRFVNLRPVTKEDAEFILEIRNNPEISKYINTMRVYFTAQNVFTLTGYSGHDPATVSMSGLTPGFDGRSYYPTQHSFNLGVSFNF